MARTVRLTADSGDIYIPSMHRASPCVSVHLRCRGATELVAITCCRRAYRGAAERLAVRPWKYREENTMSNEQVAPETKGVTVKLLATVDLGPEIEGMAGRQLRMRMVTIEPGGSSVLVVLAGAGGRRSASLGCSLPPSPRAWDRRHLPAGEPGGEVLFRLVQVCVDHRASAALSGSPRSLLRGMWSSAFRRKCT